MNDNNRNKWRLAPCVSLGFTALALSAARSDGGQMDDRSAAFVAEVDERRYLAADDWATIYRVTPRIAPEPQPFAQPPWRDRTCPEEEALVPGITEGLERLKQAILAQTTCVQAWPLESVKAVHDSGEVLDPDSPPFDRARWGKLGLALPADGSERGAGQFCTGQR